jgi:hypothetical protein
MRPLMSPEHEARLRAEMTRLGEQPDSHVWESDNGRLLTMLDAERLRTAYWRAHAERLRLISKGEALEAVGQEDAARHAFALARAERLKLVEARKALAAMGLEP